MAVTADQVVVKLMAETSQYRAGINAAITSSSRFQLRTSTALAGVDNSFVKLGRDALRTSDQMATAIASINAPVSKLSVGLDGLKEKFAQLNAPAAAIGNLPGLGGTGFLASTPSAISGIGRIERDALSARKQVRNLEFSVGNLFAQVNDVGVTAAMGMNPMIIALQQGTQFAQAFAGQKPGEVVKGLGAALGALISPTTLITIGLTGLIAVLIQSIGSVYDFKSDAEKLTDSLEVLEKAIDKVGKTTSQMDKGELDSIRDKFGKLSYSILEFVDAQERLDRLNAAKALRDVRDAIADFGLDEFNNIGGTGRMAMDNLYAGVQNLRKELDVTEPQAQELYKAFQNLEKAGTNEEMVTAFEQLRVLMDAILGDGRDASDAVYQLAQQIVQGEEAARRMQGATEGIVAATDGWATSLSNVFSELSGIFGLLEGIGGTAISNAAKQSRLEVLQAGGTIAEARRAERATEEELEFDQRSASATTMSEKIAIEAERYAARAGRNLDMLIEGEEELARERERNAKKYETSIDKIQKKIEKFDDSLLKEIASLNAETAILNELTIEQDKYGNAVARAGKEAKILQDLQNKGVPITQELKAQVGELADAWLDAADKNDIAKERFDRLKSTAQEFADIFDTALTTSFSDSEQALQQLTEQLGVFFAKLALVKLFPSLFGQGGNLDLGLQLPGKSSGGYTGPGGVHEAAGIVHKGEVVWSQADIRRAGGVGVVEAMRLGARGYASGGYVGPTVPAMAGMGRGGEAPTVNVFNESGAQIKTSPNTQGGIDVRVMEKAFKGYLESGRADGTMNRAYGLKPTVRGN